MHSLISSSQPYSVLVLVSTVVALLLYSSSVCVCPCKCSQSRVSVTETEELCVSMDVSRGYIFTFPCLFFSTQEEVVKSSVLVQFPLDRMVCYFRICTCRQSFTFQLVVLIALLEVQPVCSCIPSSDSYGRAIYCLDEVFPDKLSTRA